MEARKLQQLAMMVSFMHMLLLMDGTGQLLMGTQKVPLPTRLFFKGAACQAGVLRLGLSAEGDGGAGAGAVGAAATGGGMWVGASPRPALTCQHCWVVNNRGY
jgi:hypothetical protein